MRLLLILSVLILSACHTAEIAQCKADGKVAVMQRQIFDEYIGCMTEAEFAQLKADERVRNAQPVIHPNALLLWQPQPGPFAPTMPRPAPVPQRPLNCVQTQQGSVSNLNCY